MENQKFNKQFPVKDFETFLASNFLVTVGIPMTTDCCPINRWITSMGHQVSVNNCSAKIDGRRYSLPKILREFIEDVDKFSEKPVTGQEALRILYRLMERA